MLDIRRIEENPEGVKEALRRKNFTDLHLVDEALSKDAERRKSQKELDDVLAESNKAAKEIGALFKSGQRDEAELLRVQATRLKDKAKVHEEEQREIAQSLRDILVQIPNVAHPSVPMGNSEEQNEIVFQSGEPSKTDNKPHWEIGKEKNLFDLDLGTKITGSGFPVYRGDGAKLQRALISFFLDRATEAGYTEFIPPYLVNEASAFATGQLPDKEGQMYEMKEDPFFLIPTAEVPITNIVRDSLLNANEIPVRMTAYSPCFRREAGSYGKEVRGLNRVHQFDKVEIVEIVKPETSYDVLDQMVAHVKSLLEDLGLTYRVARLCGGDLSFTSALTYDMEVWSAGQDRWLEVSSISNFESYQANRMKLRYRDENGKSQLCHTLNGSALALPRIVAALLENNQSDRGIELPECLHTYMGKEFI